LTSTGSFKETSGSSRDEWLVGRRYLSAAAIEPLLEKRPHRDTSPDREEAPELTAALSSYHLTDERERELPHHLAGVRPGWRWSMR
jgi:hypothetical protein